MIVTAGRRFRTPTRGCAYDRMMITNRATAEADDAVDGVADLPGAPAIPEEAARRPRRVEAQTNFTRLRVTVGDARIWRYTFGAPDPPSDPAATVAEATDDEMRVVDARLGVPSTSIEAAAHRWVGSPVVAWVDVTASNATRGDGAAPRIVAVDQLLQVCIDQAVALEIAPGVGAVAVGVIVAPADPVRGAVVAVASLVQGRSNDVAEARRHRRESGRCLACDRLNAPLPSPNRLAHDGTCFGAVVRDHGDETRRETPSMRAWIVPWAHASTLAAITEDERRDLACAIVATVPWLVAHGSTWRLWFHQAPAGDDAGDVHLVGRWESDSGSDSAGWPWTPPDDVR